MPTFDDFADYIRDNMSPEDVEEAVELLLDSGWPGVRWLGNELAGVLYGQEAESLRKRDEW